MRGRTPNTIEILVAIAICAVVISVLVPVAASAQERASRKTCLVNMHNVALAAQLYAADAHETLLPMEAGRQSYDELLEPYVMIKNIWACPGAKSELPRSLGLNRAIGMSFDGSPKPSPVTSSTIEAPAKTIAFSDAAPSELGASVPAEESAHVTWACEAAYKDRHDLASDSPEEAALERHGGKGNYAFADGSARSLSPEQTIFPNVQWFVKPQAASDFLTQGLDEDDCGKIGMAGSPVGRDPVTKN